MNLLYSFHDFGFHETYYDYMAMPWAAILNRVDHVNKRMADKRKVEAMQQGKMMYGG